MQVDCRTADEKMEKLNLWRRSRERTFGTYVTKMMMEHLPLPFLLLLVYFEALLISMWDISRGDRVRSRPSNNRAFKKRKEADRPDIRLAAHEFLEKAARELFSSKESGVKGPLRIISDEDYD